MRLLLVTACLTASCCSTNSLRMEATSNVWQLINTATGERASGVPIAVQDGELWLLTARHVPTTDPSPNWIAKHRDETMLPEGRVISLHPTEDAAIMAFPFDPKTEPFITSLGFEPLELGAQVYGAGWGGGYFLWLTRGIISGHNRTSSQIAPGDSGGGLFDEQGNCIAILIGRGSHTDAHMAWVVPLADLEMWLKKNFDEPD